MTFNQDATKANIEDILQRNQREQARGSYNKDGHSVEGVRQEKRMLPPKPQANMLTKEMAEQAAVKYNKDQKKIQKAIAKVDGSVEPPPPEPSGCSCVIL